MDTGHTFNWQDTRILGPANFQRAREAIEALHSGEHCVLRNVGLRFTCLLGVGRSKDAGVLPVEGVPRIHAM